MTSDEYRAALSILGITQIRAAKFFGVNARTSRNWALGGAVPQSVSMWLIYMILKNIGPDDVEKVIRKGLRLTQP